MDTKPNEPSDVLQSHDHSKLSAEEIAKAVARHNREHSGAAPKEGSDKPKKGKK